MSTNHAAKLHFPLRVFLTAALRRGKKKKEKEKEKKKKKKKREARRPCVSAFSKEPPGREAPYLRLK
jgi:hypothetical protein